MSIHLNPVAVGLLINRSMVIQSAHNYAGISKGFVDIVFIGGKSFKRLFSPDESVLEETCFNPDASGLLEYRNVVVEYFP